MQSNDRVMAARMRLHRLENDVRLTRFEIEDVRREVLGNYSASPTTLGQAHRLIAGLEARLRANTTETPF